MDNISHRAVIRYLGLEGPREIHEDMVVKLGENDPFIQHGEDDPRPRPVTITTKEGSVLFI